MSLDVIKATGDASEFPTRVPLRCLCRSSACRYSQYLQARTALHQSLNLPTIMIYASHGSCQLKKTSPFCACGRDLQCFCVMSATNCHYLLGILPRRPTSLPIREICVSRDSDNPLTQPLHMSPSSPLPSSPLSTDHSLLLCPPSALPTAH